MPDNETNNNSLVSIHNTGLIKISNIIKIADINLYTTYL